MSERGSFTTQYIYNPNDYEIVRKALDTKSKYRCIGSPATWSNGKETFAMPIVSGKVGGMDGGDEWEEVYDAFYELKTEEPVSAVVMCDNGLLALVAKTPKGECAVFRLDIVEELKWSDGLISKLKDGTLAYAIEAGEV